MNRAITTNIVFWVAIWNCSPALAQEMFFDTLVESFKPKLSEMGSDCLYWIEFDLDAKKVDSDYFWNGGSDLYFKIVIRGDPRPIYSPAFYKNYEGGKISAPFFYSWLNPGSEINVTILDDDSGGRVLSLLAGESTLVADYDLIETEVAIGAEAGIGLSASIPEGSIQFEANLAKAKIGASNTKTTGNVKYSVVPYPDWLVQGQESEVVIDNLLLTIMSPGQKPVEIEISRANQTLGTASLWSHHTNRRSTPALKIGLILFFGLSAIFSLVGVVKYRTILR